MRGINKVIIVGNLGADPQIKTLDSGNTISNLSIATSEQILKNNQKETITEWHNVVCWNKVNEWVKYAKKGSKVYLEGKIQTVKYDKDGVTMYKTEIIASTFLCLDQKQ